MTRIGVASAVGVAAAVVVLSGCGGDARDERDRTVAPAATLSVGPVGPVGPVEPPAPVISASGSPFAAPSVGPPGAGYFEVPTGLAVLKSDGTFARVEGIDGWSPTAFHVVGPKAYFASRHSLDRWRNEVVVSELEGATARRIAAVDGSDPTFAVGRDGTCHVTGEHPTRVRDFIAGKWLDSPVPDAEEPIRRMFIDAQDRLWVQAGALTAYRRGGTWTKVSNEHLSYAGGPFGQIGAAVYAVGSRSLHRVDLEPPRDVLSMPTTHVAFSTTFAAFRLDRGALRFLDAGLQSRDVEVDLEPRAIDDRGRAWSIEDGALHVVDGVSGAITTYPAGSIPELARYSRFGSMVVVGAGPRLPAAAAPRLSKLVKGRLMRGKERLADVAIEICVEPRMPTFSKPCAGRATRREGRTDANGDFSFSDLPVVDYELAFHDGDGWRTAPGGITGLTEGGTTELAPLVCEAPTDRKF